MRLRVTLHPGWSDHTHDNPDGPATFIRDLSDVPGPLQVSWAEYRRGVVPNPTPQDLERFSREAGPKNDFGDLIESHHGSCRFGLFGTAVFRSSEYPRTQMWHVSNGRDFIMVTHLCLEAPDPTEVAEAQEIVLSMELYTPKPKWKFWS